MGIYTTVPLPRAYHKFYYYKYTTVPLLRAYHKSRNIGILQVPKHGHTISPEIWIYHKSRYQGYTTSPVTIDIYITSPETRAYYIEYRYSFCFSYIVFYRFNKAGTIIIIIKYGVYGLASNVIGECCLTAPSATRI